MKPNADEIIARFEREAREIDAEEEKSGPKIAEIGRVFKSVPIGSQFLYPSQISAAYKSPDFPTSKLYTKLNSTYAESGNGPEYFLGHWTVDRVE